MLTTPIHQNSTEAPKHGPGRMPENNPRRRVSRAHCLLAPRPYEDIYNEQAYLSTKLQQKTQRIEGLIKEYSGAQVQLSRGAQGKTRRRLRKLQNLLRCKLEEASEQEHAIFSRMGELYMEQNSRDTWERARAQMAQMDPPTDVQNDAVQAGTADENTFRPVTPSPSVTLSDLSVATPRAAAAPLYTADPACAYAPAPGNHHEFAVPRCLSSDYLETVMEEETEEKTVKTPTAPNEPRLEKGSCGVRPSTGCSEGPEVGTLEYSWVRNETQDDDDGRGDDGDCASSRASLHLRSHRFSLPVMKFTWPEA